VTFFCDNPCPDETVTVRVKPGSAGLKYVNVTGLGEVPCSGDTLGFNVDILEDAQPGQDYALDLEMFFGAPGAQPHCTGILVVNVTQFDIKIAASALMAPTNGFEAEYDPGAFVCFNGNDSNDNKIPDWEESYSNKPPDPDMVQITLEAANLHPDRDVIFNNQINNHKLRVWKDVSGTLQFISPGAFPVTWPAGTFSGVPKYWVEGVETSGDLHDIQMRFNYAPLDANLCYDKVRWTVIKTDLDVDSNNDGTIDPDDSSNGTDDKIEDDVTTSGVLLCVNDDFDEGNVDMAGNALPDNNTVGPVSSNGMQMEIDELIPCSGNVLPESDQFYQGGLITITKTGGTGSVRIFAINPTALAPGATGPFTKDIHWREFPIGTNGVEEYYKSTGPFSNWDGYFEGMTPGDVELELKFLKEGVVCTDRVRLTVVRVRVKEVTLTGPEMFAIKQDDGSAYPASPHWQDNNSDKDAEDSGERRFPTAFKKDTDIGVIVKIEVEPIGFFSAGIEVEAIANADVTFVWEGVGTIGATTVGFADAAASVKLPPYVNAYEPLKIEWGVRRPGDSNYLTCTSTDHRAYVTLDTPSVTPFESVIDIACRNAKTETVEADIVNKIFDDFRDRSVNRKTVDGFNVKDGTQMSYWVNVGDPLMPTVAMNCQELHEMLDPNPTPAPLNGIGTCLAWSELLKASVDAHGISGANVTEVRSLRKNDSTYSLGFGLEGMFLVQDWTFLTGAGIPSGDPSCAPFLYAESEITDDLGVPGQGKTMNPPGEFFNHFIIEYSGEYYDPSYGTPATGAFATQSDWEQQSLHGYKRVCDVGGTAHILNAKETVAVETRFPPP
jgi:hypothetical protein